MAKINISFNGRTYAVDKSVLTEATTDLKAHLSTAMSGEGAVVTLDGLTYNVDAEKLSEAHSDLFTHVVTNINAISTDDTAGYVNLGGIAYPISKAKISNVFTALKSAFSTLTGFVPGLYQTGAVALYREQGPDAIKDLLIKSWGDMLADGTATMTGGVLNPVSQSISGDLLLPDDGSLGAFNMGAFAQCTGLTAIIIPSHMKTLMRYTFSGCSNLTEVVIYNSMTYIGSGAFEGCTSLTDIYYTGTADEWNAIEKAADWNTNTGNYVVHYNSNVANPSNKFVPGLYQTGAVAAYRANGPEAIKDMLITSFDDLLADGIFTQGTTSTMLGLGTNAKSVLVGDFVFPSMSHLASFGFTSPGIGTLMGCSGLTGLIFPDDIGSIPWNTCTSCTSLTDVIIPYGITTIYDSAFSWCSGLTEIVIPDSVTSISGNAFSNCTGLTSIEIPDSVKGIGMSAFYGCTALTYVVIGDSVTSIGQYAFNGCSALKEVYLPALPPALTANTTFGDSSTVFYVPTAASKADYEVATNWSIYKGRFEVKQYKED